MLAYFVAAVSPNMDVANSALPAYVVSLLFFVGLLIRHEDQPDYWSWCGPHLLKAMHCSKCAAGTWAGGSGGGEPL